MSLQMFMYLPPCCWLKVCEPNRFKIISWTDKSLSASFVTSFYRWASASWNMAGTENVSQLYISHKSCRIKYILSQALASQRRTLTICGILFDAVRFKSCSLHVRSKQWIEQSSSLSPSLTRSSESSSILAVHEDDECVDLRCALVAPPF